jgi:hypothetical protein
MEKHDSRPRPPKHDADEILSNLSKALRTIRMLDESKLAERIAQLDPDAEVELDKEMRTVIRRLTRTRSARGATAEHTSSL